MMMRGVQAFAVALIALCGSAEGAVVLDPHRIAHAYICTDQGDWIEFWDGPGYAPIHYLPTSEAELRLVPEAGNPNGWRVASQVVREAVYRDVGLRAGFDTSWSKLRIDLEKAQVFVQATAFQAEEENVVFRLQRKLIVDVSAYSSTQEAGGGRNEHWKDILSDETETRGRTLQVNGGRVLGDLTLSVGTVGADATLFEVLNGTKTAMQLNPFKDVSCTFDLTIMGGADWRTQDHAIVVIRLRAAYIDFLHGVADSPEASTGDSELGASFGLKW